MDALGTRAKKSKIEASKREVCKFIAERLDKNIGKPARINRITQFEEANKHLDFKINIFGHDGGHNSIMPMRPSKTTRETAHTINLLLLDLDEGAHYVLIRSLTSAVKRVYNSSSKSKHEVCPYCLSVLSSPIALNRHMKICGRNKPQEVEMPKPGEKLKFKSINKRFMSPLFGVADFEARMTARDPTADLKDTGNRTILEKQVPVSYCLAILDSEGRVLFRREEADDERCMDLFFAALDDASAMCREKLEENVPHRLSHEAAEAMKRAATKCVLCGERFNTPEEDRHFLAKMQRGEELSKSERDMCNKRRVIDHDHATGMY